MDKKITIILVLILLIAVGIFFGYHNKPELDQNINNTSVSNDTDTTIRTVVASFGGKLKDVSLLQPATELKESISVSYSPYLTPELLISWQNNPTEALGRSVSSPWPDHIDIVSVSKASDDMYIVQGNVIEVASAEGGIAPAAVYPIVLEVTNNNGNWLISKVTKGAYSDLPQATNVVGTWECLPHKNPGEVQTMECAFGIKLSDDSGHLAVSTSEMEGQPIDFPTGAKVMINGTITPVEQLNSTNWQKYDIKGIISASSIQEVK